jgi:hypothetical protein
MTSPLKNHQALLDGIFASHPLSFCEGIIHQSEKRKGKAG